MDNKNVSQAALESALEHMQEANKRLAALLCVALAIIGLIVLGGLYLIFGCDISTEAITIDSHQGTANYIGNDGDIVNGED